MESFDSVIVGGGAIGLAIAYRLAVSLPRLKIAVIENAEGKAASRAAGAMLGCFGEVTKYTFSNTAHAEKFNLMYKAHKIWPQWMKELEKVTGEKIWHRPGTYIILNKQAVVLDRENFNAIIQALKKYKEPYKEVDPQDIAGLNPSTHARTLRAIYIEEGAIDSRQYLQMLRHACEKKGVHFVDGDVSKIVYSSNRYTLKGTFKTVVSKKIVLASGAFTSTLVRNSRLPIDIMPVIAGVGSAMIIKRTKGRTAQHVIRTANWSGSCGLHLVPLDGSYEYLGATNTLFGTPKNTPNVGMLYTLSQWAIEQLSKDIASAWIESVKVGNRPVSLDTLPLIGPTKMKGLYIATGTYRDGLHCSPIIAQNYINEIVKKKRIIAKLFLPERCPIQTTTQSETIKEYGLQALSDIYEHGVIVPEQIDDSELLKVFEERAKRIYQKLQTTVAINPDILPYFAETMKNKNEFNELKKYLRKR